MTAKVFVSQARALLEPHRDSATAVKMARYMKDHFPFLGLPRPVYQPLTKPWIAALRPQAEEALLLDIAQRLWKLPEREYQYLAGDLLDRYSKRLTPASLPTLRTLLTTKSWWDSVDQITGRVVGPLVLAHPAALRPMMDTWSQEPDFWLRRAALIHQLAYGPHTDAQRLFAYCEHNLADPEFFIRKAIGWALREHAKRDPASVRAFVESHPNLSPLSRREALKHLGDSVGSRGPTLASQIHTRVRAPSTLKL
ncbi:MAG: DNA alkylation repair protein [Bryobacteraceae bacterium]|nr:DNA alkylation repair protein [Bryobacteraceae bacterium]